MMNNSIEKIEVKSFTDLLVWQKSMNLIEQVYLLVANFPREEKYGLSDQVRRSSVSIAANIAEGHGRSSTKYYLQFLRISKGSANELYTLLNIALRVNYVSQEEFNEIISSLNEVSKMLSGLVNSLNRKLSRTLTPKS